MVNLCHLVILLVLTISCVNELCFGAKSTRTSTSSGTISITSSQYKNNMDRRWIINGGTGYRIRIKFTRIDIESPHDKIFIYESAKSPSSERLPFSVTDSSFVNSVFWVPARTLVQFKTDGSVTKSGFSFDWSIELYETFTTPNEVITASSGGVRTSHPNFGSKNYPNQYSVAYVIKPVSRHKVKLRFQQFDTQKSFDNLRIFKGLPQALTDSNSKQYSGELTQSDFSPTEFYEPVTLIFITNSVTNKQGFKFNYEIESVNCRSTITFTPSSDWIHGSEITAIVQASELSSADCMFECHITGTDFYNLRPDTIHSRYHYYKFYADKRLNYGKSFSCEIKKPSACEGYRFSKPLPIVNDSPPCSTRISFAPATRWKDGQSVTADVITTSGISRSIRHSCHLQTPAGNRSVTSVTRRNGHTVHRFTVNTGMNIGSWYFVCRVRQSGFCNTESKAALRPVLAVSICVTHITFSPEFNWKDGQTVTAHVITSSDATAHISHSCWIQSPNATHKVTLDQVTAGHSRVEFTADASMNQGLWQLMCRVTQTGFCHSTTRVTLLPVMVESSLVMPKLSPVIENSLVNASIYVTPGVPSPSVTCHVNGFPVSVTHKIGDEWMVQLTAVMRWHGSRVNCSVTQRNGSHTVEWTHRCSCNTSSITCDTNCSSSSSTRSQQLHILPESQTPLSLLLISAFAFGVCVCIFVAAAAWRCRKCRNESNSNSNRDSNINTNIVNNCYTMSAKIEERRSNC